MVSITDLFIHKKLMPGEISITTDADDTTVYGIKIRTKEPLLMKVKEEVKSWLKAQHTKIII